MLLVHGRYRFGTKRVACRNDYCTHCRGPTFTEGYRSFVVVHLYFIPLIPLGFYTRWVCARCRNDPAGKRPARAWLLLFGLVAGLVAMGVVFSVPWPDNDIEAKWGLRAIFTAFTSLVLYNLVRTDRGAYREARENVAPLGHDRCPYCGEPLPSMPEPPCGKCRVRVL
ncbi:MAG: hypothetical protein ACLQLG_10790 [Thermoguttaceae bacterium]